MMRRRRSHINRKTLPDSPTSLVPTFARFPFPSGPLPAPSPCATSKEIEEAEAAERAETTKEAAESYQQKYLPDSPTSPIPRPLSPSLPASPT